MKKNTAKKRILLIGKHDGVLPMFLSMLGALGSLISGAVGVAKAVSDSKAARRQLEELRRHNRTMECRGLYLASYKYGKGLYLGPYKREQGIISKKKKKRKDVKNFHRYNNEYTIGLTDKAHAHTVL